MAEQHKDALHANKELLTKWCDEVRAREEAARLRELAAREEAARERELLWAKLNEITALLQAGAHRGLTLTCDEQARGRDGA